MKKLLLAALIAIPTPALAEPVAYPGFAWVNVTGPEVGGEEQGNWITSGKVQQGVDWVDLNGWRLNTAVSVTASVDTKGYDWNNRIAPAVSASVRKNTEAGLFEVGVQVVHERHFGSRYVLKDSRETTGVQLFANYWVGWGQ
jgi:hypothetical protein